MMLHPAAQILLWTFLTVALQLARPPVLALMAGLLLPALFLASHRWLQLVRRTRWIMLSLLLIYGWTTPGTPLFETLPQWSPSWEGMQDGAIQLGRLLCSLAALAVLLSRLDTLQLISGLYWLCGPLRWLGLARERLAVRLALTLHYAELAMLEQSSGWRGALTHMLEPVEVVPGVLELPYQRLRIRDGVAVVLGIGLLGLFWI